MARARRVLHMQHRRRTLIAEGRANTLAQWIDAFAPGRSLRAPPRLALYSAWRCCTAIRRALKQLLDARVLRASCRVCGTAAHAVDLPPTSNGADFTALDRCIAVFERHLTVQAPYECDAGCTGILRLLFRQTGTIRGLRRLPARSRQIAGELGACTRRAAQSPPARRSSTTTTGRRRVIWPTRHCARDAMARRSARDAGQSRVVARAPVVEPPDPRPLRAGETDDGRGGSDRARARAALDAVRDLLRQASRDVSASVAALEKLPACSIPRAGWTSRDFRLQESTLEGRPLDALRAAEDCLPAIAHEADCRRCRCPHFLVREALCHLHAGRDAALSR